MDKFLVYRPLIVAFGIASVAAAALAARGVVPFAHGLMGAFLLQLAALQATDLKEFARVFAKYDPLAAKVPAYGYAYPGLEAALGFLYLSGAAVPFANAATLVLLAVNTAGVARILRTGARVQCGCAGTAYALPVGRVTLAENIAMMAMAAFMLAAP